MSSQNPGTPRPRRRIAGERKGRGAAPQDITPQPQPEPAGPERPAGPAGPAAVERRDPAPVGWPVLLGVGVLALVLLALAAGPFIDGVGWRAYQEVREAGHVEEARRTAPAAAERAATAILAYDYKTLEADRDAAGKLMTEDYRKQYLETFDKLVLDAAAETKAQVSADVRASGVSLASEDRAEVLMFVNQVTRSTANTDEQTALNRVVFTMERVEGAWRVDDITSY